MMKNLKYIVITLLIFGSMLSCDDGFIDIPNKEILTEDSFWQTKDHAVQALTSTYAAMQSASGSKWEFFEEMYTSVAYRGDDVLNNTAETYGRPLASFTNTTEESGPYAIWSASYAGIARANQILEKVPDMDELTEEDKKVFVAEAKFLRAYFYFWLVTGFENVPLVLNFSGELDDLFPFQSPPADIWAQIEKDLTEAESNLLTTHSSKGLGRATKGAAKALLGKSYLFQEKWSQAEAKLSEVTGMGYSLLPNFKDNFNGSSENGPESIFEIQFSADRSNANDERQVFNFQVSPYVFGGWELFYPSDWIVDEMKTDLDEEGNISERVYASIFFDDPNSEMYSRADEEILAYDDVEDGLNHPKYFKKFSFNEDEDFYNGSNLTIIRYADVLLMYAEALNETDKTAQAIAEVNKVRARGKAAPLEDMSKDELRDQIRHHERPVELAMEYGIRWFDLYRWQRGAVAKESIKATLELHDKPSAQNFQEKHVIYPIPLQDMNINQNLVQNPGW